MTDGLLQQHEFRPHPEEEEEKNMLSQLVSSSLPPTLPAWEENPEWRNLLLGPDSKFIIARSGRFDVQLLPSSADRVTITA